MSCSRRADGQGRIGAAAGYPDAVDAAEFLQTIGQGHRDQYGDSAPGGALVFLELFDPGALPVLGILGFPDDGATIFQAVVTDALHDVGAARALDDGFDVILRKLAFQGGLNIQLQHFAL